MLSGVLLSLLACSHDFARYDGVESRLRQDQPQEADRLIEDARDAYRDQDQLLYLLDRGMTLHWAGRYRDSIAYLEEAERLVDRLYTTYVRDNVRALMVNDQQLPYAGEPHEHVMIHVLKALNYALLDEVDEALVEARKIDHRLNVLADSADPEAYRDDPFARYFTGLLYEAAGDLTNAYVAYRKAEHAYRTARPWLKLPVPGLLKQDLLWIAKTLGVDDAYAAYRARYPDVGERPAVPGGASVVVVGFAGRAPRKEEYVLDVPISLDALQLVVLAKSAGTSASRRARLGESVLYGLYGHVVRVALPVYVSQPSRVARTLVSLRNRDHHQRGWTIRVHDLGATAKKTLADRYSTVLVRTVARAALKMSVAEGMGYGVNAAVHHESDRWIGALVAALARIFALATEEADTRSWRLLPGEIHLARLWVPAGSYRVQVTSVDQTGRNVKESPPVEMTLAPGQTQFLLHHVFE